MSKKVLKELLEAITACELVNSESFNCLESDLVEYKVTTVDELFTNGTVTLFAELPEHVQDKLSTEGYFAIPIPSEHVVLSAKYSGLVEFLRKRDLIIEESEYELLTYLNTPSSDVDSMIILGSFNYEFAKTLLEHIRAQNKR